MKINIKKHLKLTSVMTLLFTALIVLSFQNCGNSSQDQSSESNPENHNFDKLMAAAAEGTIPGGSPKTETHAACPSPSFPVEQSALNDLGADCTGSGQDQNGTSPNPFITGEEHYAFRCDDEGHVVWLSCNVDAIPASISNLTKLQNLSLTYKNGVENGNSIPASIGNLSQLELLNIANARQEIPVEIGKLRNLKELFLGYTIRLKPELFAEGNLPNLKQLYVYGLQGEIPTTIGNLKASLESLTLYTLDIPALPSEVGHLSKLKHLSIDGGSTSGNYSSRIPATIGDLKDLEYLALTHNNYHGEVPDSICKLNKLTSLFLNGNLFLTGIFPCTRNITNQNYGGNHFCAPLPTTINQTAFIGNVSYGCMTPADNVDFVQMHLGVNSSFFAFPVTSIYAYWETYSYIKLRPGVREIELCMDVNYTERCTSNSNFDRIHLQPIPSPQQNAYQLMGPNGVVAVAEMLHIDAGNYDIFRIKNAAGTIGAPGQSVRFYAKQGSAVSSFEYYVKHNWQN